MANIVNWFEIPVQDSERATTFYTAMFGAPLTEQQMGAHLMGVLPMAGEGAGGVIVHGEGYVTSADGTMVYLDASDDRSDILAGVEPAGGRILTPTTTVTPETGYGAMLLDTEGNKVALHSRA